MSENLPCLILDVTDCENWPKHHAGGSFIPAGRAPSVLQTTRDVAEQEALRLAGRHPGHSFVVLEARVVATAVKVPTHVTVGGTVFAARQMPMLMDVIHTAEIPPF